jgi:hypothetical protein
MFSGPVRFTWAKSRPADAAVSRPPATKPLVAFRRFALRRFASRGAGVATLPVASSSQNWSGAYLLPRNGERFTQIVGHWQLPRVGPGAEFGPADLPFRCSAWIGIDGKKRWSESMPQVGTEHTIGRDGHAEQPRLWWQWWLRDGPSTPHYIDGVEVHAGDTVLCSLTVVSPNLVRFHVVNRNTLAFAGVAVSEPVALRGSSAEWVVEQPSRPEVVDGVRRAGPLFPLPAFDSVLFERCAAMSAAAPGADGRCRPMRAARLVRMVRTLRDPSRIAVISQPRRRGEADGALRVLSRLP